MTKKPDMNRYVLIALATCVALLTLNALQIGARPNFQQKLYNWNGNEVIGTVTCMPFSTGFYGEMKNPYGCRAYLYSNP